MTSSEANRGKWCAVIAAGGSLDSQLAREFGSASKATVEFEGRPSVAFVLDACLEAGLSTTLVADESVRACISDYSDRVAFANPGETNIRSALHGLETSGATGPVLYLPCDLPLVRCDFIRHFIEATELRMHASGGEWFSAALSRKEEVERLLPSAEFRYIRLREGRFAAGGMFAASANGLRRAFGALETASSRRKSILRLVTRLGALNLVRYLLGRASISDAERAVGRALGGDVFVVADCHPFTAMDFDTVEDLQYLRQRFSSLRLE